MNLDKNNSFLDRMNKNKKMEELFFMFKLNT